jgi:hypothetical protein
MVKLEKIQSSLFTNLYESFLRDDDPLSSEQDWRNVFDYAWDTDHDHCGYALLDEGKVVGMIGMVFSDRLIDGASRKFCNLHTWWVREDHRGRSLALMRPILKLDEYTITHFTPDVEVRAVAKRLGFRDLNSQLKILLPIGKDKRLLANSEFIDDDRVIEDRLAAHDKRILVDHRPYDVGHLLIGEGNDYCYLLYTHVVRHRLPYCHIHYISNQPLFAKHERAIRASLLGQHEARFIALDCRIAPDTKYPRSFNFWAPAHGLYKSSVVQPHQIDHLYSDVVFLKLTTLPDISYEVRQRVRRLWPFFRDKPA